MKRKLKEWARRYLPAEILSTAVTLLSAWLSHSQGTMITALVATWSGNIAYYLVILVADLRKPGGWLFHLRNLLIEFGPAELLDALLIRPASLYYVPKLFTHFTTGILVAKICADVLFYIPAILGYELAKRQRSSI